MEREESGLNRYRINYLVKKYIYLRLSGGSFIKLSIIISFSFSSLTSLPST